MPVPSFVQSLGSAATANVPCTAGAELWVTPGGRYALSSWVNGGFCPEAGAVTISGRTTPAGISIPTFLSNPYYDSSGTSGVGWSASTLFQDTRPVSGTGGTGGTGGGTVTGELTLAPFEYTEAQQLEVYQAMASIFGAGLVALAAIWGLKRIYKLLNTDTARGD